MKGIIPWSVLAIVVVLSAMLWWVQGGRAWLKPPHDGAGTIVPALRIRELPVVHDRLLASTAAGGLTSIGSIALTDPALAPLPSSWLLIKELRSPGPV